MGALAAMAAEVRAGEASPVELVAEALRRTEAWQPVTNAFSAIHGEEALAEARVRAEEATDLGPLHGVPVAVKDLFDVAGWETTGCCAAYRGRVPARDAEVVRRLRDAGAVIVGKTNQHELAAGATNLVSACGRTRNPWDPQRMTGGSSGGSGGAVASKVVPLALGTDTGGSIRIPASMCGVTGLKSTHGRLPLDGVMPLAPSLDSVGPITVDVEDAGLAFAVLAGEGEALVETSSGPAEGLTVGSLGGFHAALVHPEVLDAAGSVAGTLVSAGVRVVAVLGDPPHGPEVWRRVAWPEFADAHGHLLGRPDGLHRSTRSYLEEGAAADAGARERAALAAEETADFFLRALGVADALLVPATPFPAPRTDADEVDVGDGMLSVSRGGVSRLTRLVNLAGLPALALPAGFSSEGLPIGVQLIGRPNDEATLLQLGRAVQAATDHHLAGPELGT